LPPRFPMNNIFPICLFLLGAQGIPPICLSRPGQGRLYRYLSLVSVLCMQSSFSFTGYSPCSYNRFHRFMPYVTIVWPCCDVR
jgi:hypothetical protein